MEGTQFIRSRFVLVLDLFCKIQYGTPKYFNIFEKVQKIQYCKDDRDSALPS